MTHIIDAVVMRHYRKHVRPGAMTHPNDAIFELGNGQCVRHCAAAPRSGAEWAHDSAAQCTPAGRPERPPQRRGISGPAFCEPVDRARPGARSGRTQEHWPWKRREHCRKHWLRRTHFQGGSCRRAFRRTHYRGAYAPYPGADRGNVQSTLSNMWQCNRTALL